jgi:hypothetical protein
MSFCRNSHSAADFADPSAWLDSLAYFAMNRWHCSDVTSLLWTSSFEKSCSEIAIGGVSFEDCRFNSFTNLNPAAVDAKSAAAGPHVGRGASEKSGDGRTLHSFV